jgi:type I restriction enzyme, S subunit
MVSNDLIIPSHWDCKPLVDCTSNKNISYGIVQPGQHDESGIGIIRVNNFENGELNTSEVLKVTPSIESKFAKTRLSGGEVLLTLVGSTGQSAVVPNELKGWNVARAVAVIKPSDEVTAEWLNICLQSSHTRNFLDARANTTVQKTLNLKDVKDVPIPLPPKDERDELERIAVNLNKKITLNSQINQTLEQMAQALFKSWFVDFDPVVDNALDAGFFEQDLEFSDELLRRAEARKAVRENADFKPLPEDIRQLFPAAFEESVESSLGLSGWLPQGWSVKTCEEVSEKIGLGPFGSNIKVSTFVEDGVPVISGTHLKQILLEEHDYNFITEEHSAKMKNSCVYRGDVIFTHAGNIGQVSLIPAESEYERYMISQRQFYMRPDNKKIKSSYLVYFFHSHDGQHKLLANASQTGVPSIARPSTHCYRQNGGSKVAPPHSNAVPVGR